MTFTNSNNNNSDGKFTKTFSSSLGSSASTPSTSGSPLGSSAGAPAKPATFTAGAGSSLSSAPPRPAGVGTGATTTSSPFAANKPVTPGAASTFSSAAQSKTVPLTSVSSATAARPAALSPSPVPPAPASASVAPGTTTARPSTFGAASPASAATTSAASATSAARPSAFTATPATAAPAASSATAAASTARTTTFTSTTVASSTAAASTASATTTPRPSAFGTAQTLSATAARPSSFGTTAPSASSAATAPRPTTFSSTATAATTAARPSTFSATTPSTASSTLGARATTAPVSSDEFAKKFAETKAALSTVKKAPLPSGTSDGGNAAAVGPGQEVTDVQYRRFAAFIEEKCGIVLGVGKQYLVNSRLSTLLSKFGISNVDELINKAMENTPNNKIQDAVIDAMTTNETLWFRDTYPYTALEQFILPELAKKAKYPVRIWSAACSSGQEPYSIGIIVQEQMAKMIHIDPKQTQIIGTDLSPEMLATCKRGQYDVHALSRGLSAERKAKFFKPTRNPNIMQIDPRVKSMVEFRPMNLLGSYALMGKFDVIFCRNVLIYFSNDVKAEILRKLTMCLNPEGYLILGSTETLVGVADKYEMVRHSPGILYRLKPQKYAF